MFISESIFIAVFIRLFKNNNNSVFEKTESLSYKKYWLFKAFRPFQSFINKYPSSLSKPSELSLYGQSDMSAVRCPQL